MSPVIVKKREGHFGVVPDAFILKPAAADGGAPVVAVHGIRREASRMVELLANVAGETGRTVVIPVFDETAWRQFQRAACRQRSDWALLRLMAVLTSEGHVEPGRFDLSGYSGGAQFAHRFAWMYPQRVGRLCVTAPGWWTFPDRTLAFPYGMGAIPSRPGATSFWLTQNFRAFLDREIVVRVGELDTQRDENLRKFPAIDARQGVNRVERAVNWSEEIRAATVGHGLPDRIDMRTLPDCAHSFADCVAQGRLDLDFVAPAPAGAVFPETPTRKVA